MNINTAQSQIFMMAFQALTDENKREVYLSIKEQVGEESDFWRLITTQEKQDIKAGLADIDNRNVTSNDEVFLQAKQWLKK